jgi:hypothetical protein
MSLCGLTVTAVQSTGAAAGAGEAQASEAVEHCLGLAHLTALTELRLRECDIALRGLAALTDLRHLDVVEIDDLGTPQVGSPRSLQEPCQLCSTSSGGGLRAMHVVSLLSRSEACRACSGS